MDSKRIKNGLFLVTLTGALLAPSQQLFAADADDALLLPGVGMEKVLNDYYLSGIDGEIEEYLVPTIKGEYLDMGFADVEEGSFLYIRSEPSINSDWVGKLYKNYAAKLAGPVGEWTKIESGSVTGYVKTEYLITGNAAQAKAEELVSAQQAQAETPASADAPAETPAEADAPEETPAEADVSEETPAEADVSEEAPADAEADTAKADTKPSEEAEAQPKKESETMLPDTTAGTDALAVEKAKESFSYAESKEEEAARLAAEAEQRAKEEAEAAQAAAVQAPAASGSGQAVVDYACQFIGNPYVWGGTSLTNGADCSGFVQSVFANFGVSLPRTTWDMEGAGVGVSYDQAIPGDIILYDGHVGIYMGNGQIVNAIDEANGIGITSATYTNIITVRRLL